MTLAVITLLQVSNDVLLGDVPRWVSCTVTLLSLETGEERFNHRIVEAVPLSAHAARHSHALQGMLAGGARVLASCVRGVKQAWRWVASVERHLECGQRQVRDQAAPPRPAHNHPGLQFQDDRQRHPPFAAAMNVMSAAQTVFGSATSSCPINRCSAMGEA